MLVPKLEKLIGIEVYATHSPGIGGIIRENIEDFVVQEVLVDGSKAEIDKTAGDAGRRALGSSSAANRYLLCVLVKRDWDTLIAVRSVARQLGVSPGHIQIAGIKDAKAVTAQFVTVEGVSAEDIQKVRVKDIEVRFVGYLHDRLSAYYLLGNSFHIMIRAVRHGKSTIQERIRRTLEELDGVGGMPNFFGHQRFGTARPITHVVGKAIVRGKLGEAAMLFLARSSLFEHPASRQARRELHDTQNFKRALKDFPKQLRYERLMLEHLAERPEDSLGAFRRLPKKLLELFVQGYQSYLFNEFLSRRIENGLSLKVAEVGDYVVGVERSGLPMITVCRMVDAGTRAKTNKSVMAGKMRLAIPLVGFRQRFSGGVEGEIERQVLNEEGISLEDFKVRALPETSERGRLRTAIVPINDFGLDGVARDSIKPLGCSVSMRFMLHRGSYATVLLREIMKPRNVVKEGF